MVALTHRTQTNSKLLATGLVAAFGAYFGTQRFIIDGIFVPPNQLIADRRSSIKPSYRVVANNRIKAKRSTAVPFRIWVFSTPIP